MNALVIPDIRLTNIPVGWAENAVIAAVVEAKWEDLDGYEASLRAMASYIDSLQSGDAVELEKALRIVEARRGELLGIGDGTPSVKVGGTTRGTIDESKATATRYRKIARHWPTIWPELARLTERRDVTQAAVLRMIERVEAAAKPEKAERREAPPSPEPEHEPIDLEISPIEEWERVEKELGKAQKTIETLSRDDKGRAIIELQARIAGLEARIGQLTTTAREAQKQADLQGRVLRKVRELLGLQNNSDIVSAIQDLMR